MHSKHHNKKFAVFDIDGTLIRWQLYHAVVDKLAKKGHLGKNAKARLINSRMHWKNREDTQSFKKYELELINVYESALPLLSAEQFDTAVDEVAKEYKLQIYTYTRDLAKSLKNDGYVLIAISGSHNELVERVARQHNFDFWVGTEYQRKNERFTGEKIVGSHDKKSTLQAIINKEKLSTADSYAIGDSLSDVSMLEIVDNPIAFNPDIELLKIAQHSNWPIVIERKNVVYKLNPENGNYVLA